VIKNNIEIFDWDDGLLDLFNCNTNFSRNILPNFIDIIDFIDVQHARVWAKLFPNLVIERDLSLLLKINECLLKDIIV
jgi:hypothetical protein